MRVLLNANYFSSVYVNKAVSFTQNFAIKKRYDRLKTKIRETTKKNAQTSIKVSRHKKQSEPSE